MATCFYCGVNLTPVPSRKKGRPFKWEDHHYSVDHIYPEAEVLKLSEELRKKLPRNFDALNTVPACRGCNNYKGRLHPLDWLVIMPYPANAKALAERLIKMGENMEEVFDAMRRRKR